MYARHDPEEIKRVIDGRLVIASVSGGKDSTAMCLYLQELGIPYQAVFMDTGWEDADTYKYIDETLPDHIGPITVIRREIDLSPELEEIALQFEERIGRYSPMVRLILKKGMFPSRVRRFCTQHLKVFTIRDFFQELDDEPVNTVGIRAAESLARSELPEWELNKTFDCDVWRPLIRWSEQDVIDIHREHGVPPNPHYIRGAARVGCWPCIFARKAEIRMISEISPEQISLLRDLEIVVSKLARERYEKRGETFESLGYHEPSWFQNPTSRAGEDGSRAGDTWPIDKVVEWSKTKRGGREEELFAPLPHEAGCVRWGFCDKSWRSAGEDPCEVNVLEILGAVEELEGEDKVWVDKLKETVREDSCE